MTEPIARDPVISGVVLTDQASAPVAPAAGKRKLFVDPAGVLKLEDPTGVVTPVGQGGLPGAHHATHEPGGADEVTGYIAYNRIDAKGDLLAGTADNTLGRVALVPIDGWVLTANAAGGTGMAWAAPPAAGMGNPMTTAADLIVGGTAGAPTRLGVGGANQVLTVVGGVLAWATPASGGMTNPMTASDDVIKGGASGTPVRLAKGADGTVLTVVGGVLTWQAPAAPGITQAAADTRYVNVTGDTMTGGLLFSPDNTVDVGASGATRPRTLWVGTSIKVDNLYFDTWSMVAANQYRIGTNVAQPMSLATNDTTRWTVTATGHLVGEVDNTYDIGASGATRPRTLYLGTSAVVAGKAVAASPDAGNALGWNANGFYAPAQLNELTNPGFEAWTRGNGAFTAGGAFAADQWRIGLGVSSAISVARDSANADVGSLYCAACAYTHAGASSLSQSVEQYRQLRGRTVTFAVRVRTATASAVRPVVSTDGGPFVGSYHSGSGAYETLTVTCAVSSAVSTLSVQLEFGATATVYVDSATLVQGSVALPYAPLHPADDLNRCARYYQEIGGLDINEFVGAGQNVSTTSGQLVVRYPVEMALAPTVTVSAPGDWHVFDAGGAALVCTAVNVGIITRRSCRLQYVVASGLVAGNAATMRANSTTAARLRFEAII